MSTSFYVANRKEFAACRMFESLWGERVVGEIKETIKNAMLDCVRYSGDRSCVSADELISGRCEVDGLDGIDMSFFERTNLYTFICDTLKYSPVNVDSANIVHRIGWYNAHTGNNSWDNIELCGCRICSAESLEKFLSGHEEYMLIDDYYQPITFADFEKMCSE